jgi:2-dehydro-3-deoxyglucarate aldolase/4-hydroxy-2-oxoheptanedioate aldolase
MEPNRFKTWLRERPKSPPLGTWLMTGAPSTAEAMGFCGFDFVVVDMEHVPIDISDAISILRAVAGTPAEAILRVQWNDQVLVKRALDAGAKTLMFPFIQTAEEACKAVAYTRYPPQGVRGVAGVHRGSRYGQVPGYFKAANDQVAVIAQIETLDALDRAGEIAAVEGVDSLFLGPADLSAAMGMIGEIGRDEVQAQIARAAELAHAAGKPIGIVGPNPEMVRRFIGYGYDWVAIGSDMAMMTGRAAEWLGAMRETGAPVAAPSAY